MKELLKETWKTWKQNPRLCLFKILRKLGVLNGMDDRKYLEYEFKVTMGYPLSFKAPKTFSEKLQWLKLNDRNPEYTKLIDKYEVKEYVAKKIGQQYIVPTLGIWGNFEDINFDVLPEQFVLKCTHDSGGLYICRDKKLLNIKKVKRKMKTALRKNFYFGSREWPYKNIKPRIIAEEYLEEAGDKEKKGLLDYKFYCFHGEPKFLYVSQGFENHRTTVLNYMTLEWKKADFYRTDYKEFKELPPKPEHFEEMIELAKTLSSGHYFLRVDFYEVNGKIYFGELTFYPGGGMAPFEPFEYELKFGEMIKLPV